MHEFIFVYMPVRLPVGSDLGMTIPLHITFLSWFKTSRTASEVLALADTALSHLSSMRTEVIAEELFGDKHNIHVAILHKTPGLLDLHLKLVASLQTAGVKLDGRWAGPAQWRPHATHKAAARLYIGDRLVVDGIDLIEKHFEDQHRRIVGSIKLLGPVGRN